MRCVTHSSNGGPLHDAAAVCDARKVARTTCVPAAAAISIRNSERQVSFLNVRAPTWATPALFQYDTPGCRSDTMVHAARSAATKLVVSSFAAANAGCVAPTTPANDNVPASVSPTIRDRRRRDRSPPTAMAMANARPMTSRIRLMCPSLSQACAATRCDGVYGRVHAAHRARPAGAFTGWQFDERMVDHAAGGHLQRGEQGGGAVPDVVVGALLGAARGDPADGSGALQRLD